MTYLQLLMSAVNNALRNTDLSQSPSQDALAIADTLFPTISQEVCETAAGDQDRRSQVLRTKVITLSAGTATLTEDVLTSCMADSVLLDTISATTLRKKYAYRPYPDFVRRGDTRLGIYSIQGSTTIQVIEPSCPFTSPLTASGDRSLTVPCLVLKPATENTTVDADPQILSDLDFALSEALRGQLIKEGIAA